MLKASRGGTPEAFSTRLYFDALPNNEAPQS
jgi:hypothetical protein